MARNKVVLIIWALGNGLAIGFFGFSDLIILRLIGALWLVVALSLSGLIVVGGMFGAGEDE